MNILIAIGLSVLCIELRSQESRGISGFPELISNKIPGAPRLSKPILITGESEPIIAQGFGLAAPAFFDMNEDGLKDLLIGEFGSGVENERRVSTGNFVRVFRNEGTESNPVFSGRFYYARPPFEYAAIGNGTPYSVDQDCCIGFTPQFVDLNNDGYLDMISGQYQGEVSWFEGTENGFLPGKPLIQDGNPRRKKVDGVPRYYWFYSSASFGDFTGDGLNDLITGGMSLRMSRNIGSKDSPSFANRELLLDTEGKPLRIYHYLSDDKEFKLMKLTGTPIPESGNPKLSPYVVDWDNDGLLDILVTNSYSHTGLSVVDFFKGVKINSMYRFEKAKPLFVGQGLSKAFPGSSPRVFVTDYNNDGVNDLLIGASIAFMNGRFNDKLAWAWESDLELYGAGRDPFFLSLSGERLKTYKETTDIPEGIAFDDFITISHVGYVYVMLGYK